MSARFLMFSAAISGFICVALGAFASHLLKSQLSERLYDVLQTGIQYQMFHTLALLLVAVLLKQQASALLRWSGGVFLLGMLLFCGSLYLLALSGQHWLGAVTPVGGTLFLIGWGCLAVATLKRT